MAQTPVTELATLVLKPGLQLTGSTPEAEAWSNILKTITEQPGFQSLTWGLKVENPLHLVLCIDWDTLQAHKEFIQDPVYGPFAKKVQTLIDDLSMHHYTPQAAFLSSVPVVETCTIYNVPDDFYTGGLQQFKDKLLASKWKGLRDVGIAEVVEPLSKDKDGEEGRACKLFIAWDSIDDHMAFRETSTFKENIHLLRDGAKGGIELFHLPFSHAL